MENSFFDKIVEAPADPIFKLTAAFNEDPRRQKVNLSVGIYRDENLETPVLKSVKKAEKYLLAHEMSKEYLPIGGDALFINETGRLIFGEKLWNECSKRICGIQTPGGTGALKVGGDFLRNEVSDTIALPDPTWPNHPGVFQKCGFKIDTYSYYDVKKHQLDSRSIFEMLKRVPERSVVLFHACCHNPTGADLSDKEWEEVAQVMKKRQLLPFFDFAYQGFGRGIEEDAKAIRVFISQSLECVVASSYSKNFGLYAERVGSLFMITKSEDAAKKVLSKLKIFARTSYSNPPKHGAAIIAYVLSNLKGEWVKEVEEMRLRIEVLRKKFVKALPAEYLYLLDRRGMFCFLAMSDTKVERLREEYGIYMAEGGRINLAGLSEQNFDYVMESLLTVL